MSETVKPGEKRKGGERVPRTRGKGDPSHVPTSSYIESEEEEYKEEDANKRWTSNRSREDERTTTQSVEREMPHGDNTIWRKMKDPVSLFILVLFLLLLIAFGSLYYGYDNSSESNRQLTLRIEELEKRIIIDKDIEKLQETVKLLESKTKDLESTYKKLKEAADILVPKVKDMDRTLKELKPMAKEIDGNVTALKPQVEHMETSVLEMKPIVETLEKTVFPLETKVEGLVGSVGILSPKVQTLEDQVSILEPSVKQTDEKVREQLEPTVKKMEHTVSDIEHMETSVLEMKPIVETLEKTVFPLETKVEGLVGSVGILSPKVQTLEVQVSILEPSVKQTDEKVREQLEPTVKKMEHTVSDMEPKVNSLQVTVVSLKPTVKNLDDTVSWIKPMVPVLDDTVKTLSPKVKTLEDSVPNLEHRVKNLDQKVTISETLTEDVTKLKATTQDMQNHLSNLGEYSWKNLPESKNRIDSLEMSSKSTNALIYLQLIATFSLACWTLYSYSQTPTVHVSQSFSQRDQTSTTESANKSDRRVSVLDRIHPSTLTNQICVVSFYLDTNRALHMRLVESACSGSELSKVNRVSSLVSGHEKIPELPRSKIYLVFVDFNERDIILEHPEREIGDLRMTTVQGARKMGGDVFVVYVKDKGSQNLDRDHLYNERLHSIVTHPELSVLNEKQRVLTTYDEFTVFQRTHLAKCFIRTLQK
ncbi:myosin heavy chain, clone 203-like isoform X2 [Argopecten irradians]|uniref:myosin heavy chain, clone 203-like isoform X2 n=1 Tax=Argopecten irradians TaxID=31199 RepID=UPI0037165DFC